MNFSDLFSFDFLRGGDLLSHVIVSVLLAAGVVASANPGESPLLPVPASLEFTPGRLTLTPAFRIALTGDTDARLLAGLTRALLRVEARTGLTFPRTAAGDFVLTANPAEATLVISCASPGASLPKLGEEESYSLLVGPTQAVMAAPTGLGALHALETLLQLLQSDADGWFLPAVTIRDQPRFPWRGLMIDVARHWQPLAVILRNLDGMALVKLNVLHLHLTDDQGFRIECKTFPRLHELGSDGHYFTQDQMREIIAYAAARGIRVVPEFDIPGHATSWVVGYPELASAPGPYAIERKWGVFDPVLDPTNPQVYALLDGFLGEMAALFPDPYLHIGGDENNGKQWSANPKIQAYIQAHRLKDNAGLHAYFNTRVHAILTQHDKQLIGWDEILHPDLPAGSVIHSWRGAEGLADATQHGYAALLSHGYYIDLSFPAWEHYLNDPVPADSTLTPVQQERVLGGEATMWAEWVTPETIDSRIWPRTAAIAERLWSRREVRDVPDMYRRLVLVSQRLEEAGLQHASYLDPALRRLAGDSATPADLAALRTFVDLLEPVKNYRRGGQQPDANQFTPLTGLVDCARPDSASARALMSQVESWVMEPKEAHANNAKDRTDGTATALSRQLQEWKSAATLLSTGLAVRSPRLHDARPLLDALIIACTCGEESTQALLTGHAPDTNWLPEQFARLDQAARAHGAAELPIIAALKLLAAAAAEQNQRSHLPPAAWRQHLAALVSPPAAPLVAPAP